MEIARIAYLFYLWGCSLFSLIESRLEELQEKYSQEVEERKRLEAELKVLQVKVSS